MGRRGCADLARLIVRAKRPWSRVPKGRDARGCVAERSNHEIDALRERVIAEAHLDGRPAPRGWTGPLHGKDVNTTRNFR